MSDRQAEIDALREYIRSLELKIGTYELQREQLVSMLGELFKSVQTANEQSRASIADAIMALISEPPKQS